MDFTPKQKLGVGFARCERKSNCCPTKISYNIWNWGQKLNQNNRPEVVEQNYGFGKLKQKKAKHKA
jgi:hypothetical protein